MVRKTGGEQGDDRELVKVPLVEEVSSSNQQTLDGNLKGFTPSTMSNLSKEIEVTQPSKKLSEGKNVERD